MGKTSAEKAADYRRRKYAEFATMPKVPCECGCGTLIAPITKNFVSARYVHGHNPERSSTHFPKGQQAWNKGLRFPNPPWRTNKGIKPSPESIAKARATRFAHFGAYISPEAVRAGIEKRPKTWKDNVVKAILKRDLSGPNNPAWQNGISLLPYGPEFTKRLKRLIRARDKQRCQHCGQTAKQERKEVGRLLSIHHIDHDKANNDPTNLVAVCNSCNVYFSHHRDESLSAFPRRRMLLEE